MGELRQMSPDWPGALSHSAPYNTVAGREGSSGASCDVKRITDQLKRVCLFIESAVPREGFALYNSTVGQCYDNVAMKQSCWSKVIFKAQFLCYP